MNMKNKIKVLMLLAFAMVFGGILTAHKSLARRDRGKLPQVNRFIPYISGAVNNDASQAHRKQSRPGHFVVDVDEEGAHDYDNLFRHLVVVTAFSQNHAREAMGMIGTAQRQMPTTPIVVYDLGIENSTLAKVKTFCNVEVRPFDFKKYPSFVSKLSTYAWKVVIIKETLNEFGVIFWGDASVRFTGSLRSLLPFAAQHHGYLSPIHSYRAQTQTPVRHNYFLTVPAMFDALGVDRAEFARSPRAAHPASNRQLYINGSALQRGLLRPLYACALDQACISPPGAAHGVNHRFDASALMLVLYRYFPGEFDASNDHRADVDAAMFMHRSGDDWQTAQICSNGTTSSKVKGRTHEGKQ